MSTVRETLYGHDWIDPFTISSGFPADLDANIIGKRFRSGYIAVCACGWRSDQQKDRVHCYAAFILHLSERMCAAIALLDAAHRENAFDHGDGLVVIPDTPREVVAPLRGMRYESGPYAATRLTACSSLVRLVRRAPDRDRGPPDP